MNTEDLAYLAGIVDGEGCITIFNVKSKKPNGRPICRLALVVVMNNPEPLELLAEIFGGKVSNASGNGSFRYAAYSWHAGEIISELLPYLRVKRLRADIAIRWCYAHTSSSGQHLCDNEYKAKEELYKEMKRSFGRDI